MKLKTLLIATIGVSVVSLVVSIIALCVCVPRSLEFDYIGVIVGILALLVTILIGWNIYTVISFREEVRKTAERVSRYWLDKNGMRNDDFLSKTDIQHIINSVP